MGIEMYFTNKQVKLYYEAQGKGEPLLLIHGNGEDHTIFDVAIKELEKHYTVYALDTRGHGNSDPVMEYHYQDMADDICVFLEGLQLENVTYFGFSDGGIVGLLVASQTKRIKQLFIAGVNLTPKGIKWWARKQMQWEYFWHKDSKIKLMLTEPNITKKQLMQIQIPTTILVGENDVITKKETKELYKGLPNATLYVFKGQTHSSYIIHKASFVPLLITTKEKKNETN